MNNSEYRGTSGITDDSVFDMSFLRGFSTVLTILTKIAIDHFLSF